MILDADGNGIPINDKTWDERAEKVIAQGCLTYSKRSDQYVKGLYPTHVEGADPMGKLECTDGKSYYDFVGGLGANLIQPHNSFTLPTVMEVILAEKIVERIKCIDKLRFLKTGSDACSAAVRIARAYTGKSFGIGSGYHGWHNSFIEQENPGVGCVDESYLKCKHLTEIIDSCNVNVGYCIIEPVMLDMSDEHIQNLRKLREICTKYGIVLIHDEVILGYRTPQYCMSNYLDIQPDLICLGKAMANGHPLSVVGGKKEIMDTPDYFVSSTFAGDEMSLFNSILIHDFIDENPIEELWERGKWFQEEMNKALKKIDVRLVGIPTRATWAGNETNKALFWQEMLKQGYLFGKAFFLMYMYTDAMLKTVIREAHNVCESIKNNNVKLEGDLPKEVFARNPELKK